MNTIKEILSENRESVISSIKFVYKVWKAEDVKVKMVEFLAYCETNTNADDLAASKRLKTDLKVLVQKMAISQKSQQPKMKLADIMCGLHEDEKFNFLTKTWGKY